MLSGEWRVSITPEERELYDLAGFGHRIGFGTRPALLVIDVQYRTVGDAPAPIRESIIRYYRTSCGEYGWRAVWTLQRVLTAARERGIPVIYPYVAHKSSVDAGQTGAKIPSLMEIPDRGYCFVGEVKPLAGDLLIPKRHPSAFFGTALVSYLIDMSIDTLLITGCTTSGCVRASAVDACAFNFRCGVIEDCVYDRSQTSHNVNLFDIQSKYGDVIAADAAIEYMRNLERSVAIGASR